MYEEEFSLWQRQTRQKPRGRRRRLCKVAMKYALENAHKYATAAELQSATRRYLSSGAQVEDEEYGSFILSFVLGPILAALINRIVLWVWDRYHH